MRPQVPAHTPTVSMSCSPLAGSCFRLILSFQPFFKPLRFGGPCSPGQGAAVTLVVPQGHTQTLPPCSGTITPKGCPHRQGQGLLSPQSPRSL